MGDGPGVDGIIEAADDSDMGRPAHLSTPAGPFGLTLERTVRTMGRVSPGRGPLLALIAAGALALPAVPAAAPSAAPSSSALTRSLTRALSVPHVRLRSSGAAAIDLSSGEPLFALNGSAPFAPASNEKLATTFAALSALGPTFRFETDVAGDGELSGAVWHGDVYLEGHGDPTLTSARLAALAGRVRAAGIRRITGSIVGDESWFDARRMATGWKASFYLDESPPLSSLVVDRSRYGNHVSRTPALAAALLFRSALRKAGVAVPGAATTGVASETATPLASVESARLAAIVRWMDLTSDNFTAEMLLKELGAVETGKGTSAAGAAVVTRLLADAGVPLEGVRIVDGSGLSYADRLTANALVALLQAMWSDPTLRPYVMQALPVAGRSGTLAHRLLDGPATGVVAAKTGTTSIASALSGFVKQRVAFAVLENGHPLAYWWARRAQDRFAIVLARYLR
jgi:serine-type D-Ala-D-Ala carboxypeptidase/endopeptidase (penicillin-binding protein 4)